MKFITQILLLCLFTDAVYAVKSLPFTGEHSIGSKSFFIVDTNRAEVLTKNTADFRRIAIQAFYPSIQTGDCSNRLESPFGKKVESNNCVDREILKSNEKYPIVILSPGFGGSYLMNMTLAEEIASHGYYVINVGHTFFNATPTFPDGRKIALLSMDTFKMETDDFLDERFRTRLNTYINIQKDDIISILDQLTNVLDEDHLNAVDLENIACIGYSAGGAASADVCAADARVKAGVNINGVLYGDAWKYSLQQPFLYVNADYSNPKKKEINMLGGLHVIDSIMSFYNERKKELSTKSTNDFYELTLFNTTHHNFSDMALVDQSICGKTNPKKCLERTYLYIRLFLDNYLKKSVSDELETYTKSKKFNFEVVKKATTIKHQ